MSWLPPRGSKQEIIRRSVFERYERAGHRAVVGESAVRLREQWTEVLHRFGTV